MYTHRTLIRHILLALILLILPYTLIGAEIYLAWLKRNALFLSVTLMAPISIGMLSHRLVTEGIFYDLISDEATGPAALLRRMLRCSRCLAYLSGGIVAAIFALIYFPGWVAAIYFFVLGASIASAAAVALQIAAIVSADDDGTKQ